MADPGGLDFFDFSGTEENWWEDFGPDFDSTPIIDLSAADQLIGAGAENADLGAELFVNPSTGMVVNGSGANVFSQEELDTAMRAYREGERDLSAATPGSPEEKSIWDRIGAAFGPINAALRSPLGATLATLGLGAAGAAIGAGVAGNADALQRLARSGGPALPPAIVAGQTALNDVIAGSGGADLKSAIANALAAQAGAGQYFTDSIARESAAEAIDSPQLAAIRQAAIARMPSTAGVLPEDQSSMAAPLVARANQILANPAQSLRDPVAGMLQNEIAGLLLAGRPGAQPLIPIPGNGLAKARTQRWVGTGGARCSAMPLTLAARPR